MDNRKFVKFKKIEEYGCSIDASISHNKLHMENQGKTFEVYKIRGHEYEFKELYLWFDKERFEEVKLVNLPDELFRM